VAAEVVGADRVVAGLVVGSEGAEAVVAVVDKVGRTRIGVVLTMGVTLVSAIADANSSGSRVRFLLICKIRL
jgi:hypothetical protein